MCRLLWQCLVISLFFMFLHSDVCSSSSSPSKPALCSPDQSSALLHFKNSFNFTADGFCSNPKTEYWKEGSDCCSWDGVTCDRLTGHVIGLDVSCSSLVGTLYPNNTLFHLHHLRKLDLSRNNFLGSEISSMFGLFTKLTHLDLSTSNFSGSVPPEISYLSNLASLDLSYNPIQLHQHSFDRLSQNLTNLRVLALDSVNLSSIAPCSLVNLSSSLISLHLSSTGLQGKFPNDVLRFPFLEQLDLSLNGPFIGHLPKSNWSSLFRLLDFGGSNFYGDVMHDQINLPDAIGDLVYLNVLNVASCGFKGSVLKALFNLTRLTSLHLGNNNFSGRIPASISNLDKLTDLHLFSNEFSGQLPSSIFNLTQLSYMSLFSNQLEGHFPSQVRALPHLTGLDLSNNLLSGRIPSWLLALPSLQLLDLSNNKLTGPIDHFKLEGHFPSQVRALPYLIILYLSNNLLSGRIPSWLLALPSLHLLDLSNNKLTGPIDPFKQPGPLAVPPHSANMTFFSVSHNNLTGEISSTICNMNSLKYLILANNSFSGLIPECLRNYKKLEVLDLSMNNFHGSIPQIFPNGSSLKTINLNCNQLEGPLPTSLANCSSLEVLDVGNNMVNGAFPLWLATFSELQVLVLRSNKFTGSIGNFETRFPFVKLRILDIAYNQFTGILPTKLFEGFKTMMHGHDKNISAYYMGSSYYRDHVVLTWKGVSRRYERILTILITIDLSSNQFQGNIPKVVGELKSLKVFNLSHNLLTGPIPSLLRNLTELESLDLSSNKLVEEIPMQLTSLTSLSVLNVSYNQLMGSIPQENQFSTFENNSYIGNLGLCGPPLSKKCVSDEEPEATQLEESFINWTVIMMGYGCGLVIGLSMGYIVLSLGKPHWFVKIVNKDRCKKVRKISKSHQRRN